MSKMKRPCSPSHSKPLAKPSIKPSEMMGMAIANSKFNQVTLTHDVDAAKLRMPELPKGVIPEGMAMDASPYDYSVASYASGGQGFLGYPYLATLSTRPEYRAMASAMSTDLTREWVSLNSTSDDEATKEKLAQIEAELKRLNVRSEMQKASELDCYYGRGQLLLTFTGQDIEKPLVLSSKTIAKGSLESVRSIDAMWTTPQNYNAIDPSRPDFYKPSMWFMLGKQIHASRLLTIITRPLPDMLKPAYNFSGISLSQLAQPYVENWLRTRQSISDIINAYSITILATDMAQIMQGGVDADASFNLLKRADLFTTNRSNQGLMLLDKEREEIQQVNTPLSGLHELQSQAQEHMCSVSHIPAIKLTGISPNGMNASTEGEVAAWYDWVAAQQEAYWREPLEIIIKAVQISLFGEIDDGINFTFNSLHQNDDKQDADIRLINMQIDAGYLDHGVIDAATVAERLSRDEDSGYHGLDFTVPELPDDTDPTAPPEGDEDPENDNDMAQDADRWITVHPNGKNSTGTPALIGEGGEVKAGMGGKFNGKNIKDAHGTKNFTSGETNAETEARNKAGSEKIEDTIYKNKLAPTNAKDMQVDDLFFIPSFHRPNKIIAKVIRKNKDNLSYEIVKDLDDKNSERVGKKDKVQFISKSGYSTSGMGGVVGENKLHKIQLDTNGNDITSKQGSEKNDLKGSEPLPDKSTISGSNLENDIPEGMTKEQWKQREKSREAKEHEAHINTPEYKRQKDLSDKKDALQKKLDAFSWTGGSNSEAAKIPEGINKFIDIAKNSKTHDDFYNSVKNTQGVSSETADWFGENYNYPDMKKASEAFYSDILSGKYSEADQAAAHVAQGLFDAGKSLQDTRHNDVHNAARLPELNKSKADISNQIKSINGKIKEASLKIGGGASMLKLDKMKLQSKLDAINLDIEKAKKSAQNIKDGNAKA